jgi:hypothetical protein
MVTQVQLDYVVTSKGASVASLAELMQSVPVPQDVLQAIGAQLKSDGLIQTTTTVTRRILVQFAPTVDATVSGVTIDERGGIEQVFVGTGGGTYGGLPEVTVGNPIPTLQDGIFRPTLDVSSAIVVNGGTDYVSPTVIFQGGLVPPQIDPTTGLLEESCLQLLTIADGGFGYSANAAIQFNGRVAAAGSLPTATGTFDANGQLVSILITNVGSGIIADLSCYVWDPGPGSDGQDGGTGALIACSLGVGTPATATLTVVGNVITAVNMVTAGGPYVEPPDLVVTDSAGSGAVLVAQMEINSIDVVNPGGGYVVPITFVIEPLFLAICRGNPTENFFANLMTAALSAATLSPVVAVAPVFS